MLIKLISEYFWNKIEQQIETIVCMLYFWKFKSQLWLPQIIFCVFERNQRKRRNTIINKKFSLNQFSFIGHGFIFIDTCRQVWNLPLLVGGWCLLPKGHYGKFPRVVPNHYGTLEYSLEHWRLLAIQLLKTHSKEACFICSKDHMTLFSCFRI